MSEQPRRRVMVIRHAEKPTAGGVLGVNLRGNNDANDLSVRGWQRAGALVGFFRGTEQREGIGPPRSLFAAGVGVGSSSVRAPHTLLPLSQWFGLPIETGFAKGQEGELLQAVAAAAGPVLIAWEHKAIIDIANALAGGAETTPQAWPDDRFDLVWVFDFDDGAPRFSQVAQMLLQGDSEALLPLPRGVAIEQGQRSAKIAR